MLRRQNRPASRPVSGGGVQHLGSRTRTQFLHRAERRITTTKTVRETEAEAIAFVVGTTIGLNTGNASASYIQLYDGNAALLAESLEVIQKTSAVILSALETHAAEPATESEPEASKPPATERDGAGRTVAADILKKTA